ncbi:vacuolar sorting protein [Dendrothele bispora CBS 962.96]|uniref:Vacuolar sorting protein n=1 Tax=Dendrothele bispora (strain CBS 962.96) TaxID=1314807 RepID=A0A4S8MYD4_DENBC|nr:vacuolar sorting protein [Dendrothele bispora CBS 962.96]
MTDHKEVLYSTRAKDFVDLHDQVETSVSLLDSLESFLSTFQKDLSAVSGQISELQDRSKDIENRLKSRRKIEKPLSSLITDIVIPPTLTTLILDTDVSEPWIAAIDEFERHLDMTKARSRVKAARDLGEVVEGLRIVAATKLRAFFLALFQPIRSSVTTNMQVLQTSVLIKYRPLFTFLQHQAPTVANEVQRSYIGAARTYYETGFRRYIRSLGWLKSRCTDKFEPITTGEKEGSEVTLHLDRLSNAKLDGPSVTLAYMADDKAHKEPVEALLRSILIVFMDNTTAEYTFIKTFFPSESHGRSIDSDTATLSPTSLLSPTLEQPSISGSDYGGTRSRAGSVSLPSMPQVSASKDEQANNDAIWKQIFDPVTEYVQTFVKTIIDPSPPVISLLTMIRLTERVLAEVENRECPPGITFLFGIRLQLWPVFQKLMNENIEAVKRVAEGSGSGYFSRAVTIAEGTVKHLCNRYVTLFTAFVSLTDQEEETMIFSNLLRVRQELEKVIQKYVGQISDAIAKGTTQTMIYEVILQGLNKGVQSAAHPKSQHEIAYWSKLEEEARRKLISVRQAKRRQ